MNFRDKLKKGMKLEREKMMECLQEELGHLRDRVILMLVPVQSPMSLVSSLGSLE
jgi:hypothetical protein